MGLIGSTCTAPPGRAPRPAEAGRLPPAVEGRPAVDGREVVEGTPPQVRAWQILILLSASSSSNAF